jgi:ABC-type polysaccharide/polyol phosphate export permease
LQKSLTKDTSDGSFAAVVVQIILVLTNLIYSLTAVEIIRESLPKLNPLLSKCQHHKQILIYQFVGLFSLIFFKFREVEHSNSESTREPDAAGESS